MSVSNQNAGGQINESLGLIDFQPTLTSHEDITPGLLPLEDKPFNQTEWPVPQRKGSIIVGISTRPPQDDKIAFNQDEWPNPILKVKSALTWLNDNQNNVLAPTGQNPFNQTNWSNPLLKQSQNIGYVFNKQLETPTTFPFIPVDYPNPLLKIQQNKGSVNSRPQYYQDIQPFDQTDWKVPEPKKLKSETWIQNLLQSTLTPGFVQSPFNLPDFPNPGRKSSLMVHISSYINIAPPNQPPFVNDLFINPILVKKRSSIGWEQNRQFYYQDIKPFKQDNYPNPQAKKGLPNTFIFNRKLDEPTILNPFISVDYPNPLIKKGLGLTWIFQAPFQQIFTHPVGNAIFDNPVLRFKPAQFGWFQPRPQYYSETLTSPFLPLLLIPPTKKYPVNTFISTKQLTSIVGTPFSQNHWPNPQIKRRPNDGFESYFVIDSNQPSSTNLTESHRLHRPRIANGWIFSPQITEAIQTNPIRTFDYQNPILLKKQNQGFIINLLGSTLFPSPGAVPFKQTEYPNPIIGKRNFHSGWLQDKKFYYTEPSLMIAQYDWPVFRAIKRNQVGFIDFKIQSSSPNFTQVTNVPLRSKRTALTWLYNSLIDLTFVTGLVPFNQYDWPIIRVKKGQISDIILRAFILEIITGRSICLLADDTEYYLEAQDELYDLDARTTEFNLEAGGTECE